MLPHLTEEETEAQGNQHNGSRSQQGRDGLRYEPAGHVFLTSGLYWPRLWSGGGCPEDMAQVTRRRRRWESRAEGTAVVGGKVGINSVIWWNREEAYGTGAE